MSKGEARSILDPVLLVVEAIARFSIRWPAWTLALGVLCTGVSIAYATTHMRMNSDYRQLISRDAPFRAAYEEHLEAFPQFRDMTIVVLDGESVGTVDDAQSALATALRSRTDVISSVYAPGADDWFEDHAFLYLDTDELERVVARLARAQPTLAALSVDPSLRGLLDDLRTAVERLSSGDDVPAGFAPVAERVAEAARSLAEGRPRPLSWSSELFDPEGRVYRVVIVQGRQEFDETVPAEKLIATVHAEAERLGLTPEHGVRVRLTGLVPLLHDELVSILDGIYLSAAITGAMLFVILGLGLRSLRVILGTLCALALSLASTTAWAMWSVGEFNTISSAFSVLLIGLGVDFGIHIGLRYEEALTRRMSPREALEDAVVHTVSPISLCALTSAIGFASFIPTEFRGLASLGVIASGGMLLSLVASYTVLPAVLALTGVRKSRIRVSGEPSRWLQRTIELRAPLIVTATAVAAVLAIPLAITGAVFDFDTLSLRDPESESMVAMQELRDEKIANDFSVTVTARSVVEAEQLADRLADLDLVSAVEAPSDQVPDDQAEKLLVLEEASYLFESVLYPPPPEPPPTGQERVEAVRRLVDAARALPEDAEAEAREAAAELGRALAPLLDASDPVARIAELERLVIGDLPERLAWLRRALQVGPVTFDELPAATRERIVAADGQALVVVFPEESVDDVTALERFVSAVRSIAPGATGRPVVEAELGDMVVRSFRVALAITLVSIFLILLVTLRSLGDALMVLVPITLAAFFTTAFAVLAGIHFNMVNVIAVPLILGLGVDSGIHVVMRFRESQSLVRTIGSTTPRAVALSALTTLAAFGSLSISPHRGMSSLGVLLSVSIFALLYCSLVVLPAMLAVRNRFTRGGTMPGRARPRSAHRVRE